MIFKVDLYIEGQKVDLFENESIRFVESIRNLRDPGVNYSPFTQSFTVPASDNNNQVFRHFYNADITNGFDARLRVDAELRLSGVPFREGQVKVERAVAKNDRFNYYELIFYADAADLKSIAGDLNIRAISGLDIFDHPYSFSTIKDGFEVGLDFSGGTMVRSTDGDPDIIYPFISHTKQYAYDSSASPPLYNFADPTEALDHNQLKPGMRLARIVLEGFLELGLSLLALDTFADTAYRAVYMWCHGNEGNIVSFGENLTIFNLSTSTFNSGTDTRYGNSYFTTAGLSGDAYFNLTFDTTITGSGNYDVIIRNLVEGNPVLYEERNLSGNQTISIDIFPGDGVNYVLPSVEITSEGTITQIDLELNAGYVNTLGNATGEYLYDAVTPNDDVNIRANLPDMKFIDLVSSILKMYNGVLYKVKSGANRGSYVMQSLEDFYNDGSTLDITPYVDESKEITVKPSTPFTKINFEFDEAESFLMENRRRILNDEFGNDSYYIGNLFDQNEYTINPNFEKILFERMEDLNDGSASPNMWAWCVDEDEDPYIGSPILFYGKDLLTLTDIEWEQDGSTTTAYRQCSNTITDGTDRTLGFKPEIGEFVQQTLSSSLFEDHWANYMAGVYDIKSRIVTVSAVLPQDVIRSYNMNDTVIYKGKAYFINEIDIDLTTGEAEIELITKWL